MINYFLDLCYCYSKYIELEYSGHYAPLYPSPCGKKGGFAQATCLLHSPAKSLRFLTQFGIRLPSLERGTNTNLCGRQTPFCIGDKHPSVLQTYIYVPSFHKNLLSEQVGFSFSKIRHKYSLYYVSYVAKKNLTCYDSKSLSTKYF